MTARRFFLLLLIFSFPLTAHAGVSADDLPGDLVWYMHADLEQMRDTESGSPLYEWFDDEVIVEINDEVGINLSTEVDSVTAFSNGADSTVIIIEGPLTKTSQDKLLATATLEATVNRLESGGKEYYHVKDNDDDHDHDDDDDSRHRGNNSLDGFDDGAWFSFSVANKAIITSNENQMQELLKNAAR